ncbi:MAG: YIP1 family protein [Nitrosopumilus sp.]|nr:YIP1 family protein [Nitrosopumilus sp.]
MPFDLNVILRVITSPNSAFAQIRDNEEKYFAQSIGLLVVSSVLSVFVILPFVMIPLSDAYFEGVDDVDLPTEGADIVWAMAVGFLKGIVSFVALYFIGKKLGGNTNWKKVFSVIFHTYVPVIPMMIIISVLVFLMWGSLAEIDPSYLMSTDVDEEQVLSAIGPLLVYALLVGVFAIAFMVWIIVISVKAIKTVNGFETGKAFGLLILVMIIASAASVVFNV